MEIAVIGKNDFTLGFRLTGIKNIMHFGSEADMKKILDDGSAGVVITDQDTFDSLNPELKEEVISSINPVVVVVSDKPQEELRNMIIRSIGIDLLKGDE